MLIKIKTQYANNSTLYTLTIQNELTVLQMIRPVQWTDQAILKPRNNKTSNLKW